MHFDLRPVFVPVLIVLVAACGGGAADDEESIREELSEKGTLDLIEEIEQAEYEPPSDGELTEDQIDMFLEVKARERKIQDVAAKNLEEKQKKSEEEGGAMGFLEALQAVGDAADFGTAGMRAAVELGHNPKEFAWVQEKILEVYAVQRHREASEQMGGFNEQLIEHLEQQRDMLPEEQRAKMEEQIEEMRKNAEQMKQDAEEDRGPGFEHNRELVEEHREDIEQAFTHYERALTGVGADDSESGE